MNWFLLLLILLMFAGGYYAYQNFEDQLAGDQTVIDYQQKKLDTSQAASHKVVDQTMELKASLAAEKTKEADLKKQLDTALAAETALNAKIAELTPKPDATASANAPAPPPPPPGIPSKLGTIRAGGKTYTNCQLLRVQADGIVVSFDDGIIKLLFAALPPSLQKEYGFDPKLGTLTDDQVAALEQQRQASAEAGR